MFDKKFRVTTNETIVIIGNKHGLQELPYEFPNDLRLSTLGN